MQFDSLLRQKILQSNLQIEFLYNYIKSKAINERQFWKEFISNQVQNNSELVGDFKKVYFSQDHLSKIMDWGIKSNKKKLIEEYIGYLTVEDRVEHHRNFRCKYFCEYLSRNEYDISYLKLKSDNRLEDKHLQVKDLISSVNSYSCRKLEDIKYSSKFKYSYRRQNEPSIKDLSKLRTNSMQIDDCKSSAFDPPNDLFSYYSERLDSFRDQFRSENIDHTIGEHSIAAYERIQQATLRNTKAKTSYRATARDEEKIINTIKNIHCLYKDIRYIITAMTHTRSIKNDEKEQKKQNLKKANTTMMAKVSEILRLKPNYPNLIECIESLNDLRKKSKETP